MWRESRSPSGNDSTKTQGESPRVELLTRLGATSAVFDDPKLVSASAWFRRLVWRSPAGPRGPADEHLTVPTDRARIPG